MFEHIFTQLIRSMGIFLRTIRAFFTRRLVGLTTRARRLLNFSRNATKMALASLQGAASLAKKPTRREDYIETGRLFISKSLLVALVVGGVAAAAAVYFFVWPFILSRFFTAHFYIEDWRVENWTGRAVVYYDKQKTTPFQAGRLTDGLLEGEGKEYDEAGLLCYEGSFRGGTWDGTGTAYQDGVLSYQGQFQAGIPAGEGISYYPDGQASYRGEFAGGLAEGQGTAYDSQGRRIYEGGFSQGLYQGQGSLYLVGGQRIDGTFAAGAPEGAVRWLKNGVLYYEGEWGDAGAEGFGRVYSQSGKVLYEGRLSGGAVDGPWLLELGLEELRAALGETKLQQNVDPSGGFTITSPALGLTAHCRSQQEGTEAGVNAVSVFPPQGEGKDWVELLPGRLAGPELQRERVAFTALQGVPLESGTYNAQITGGETGDCQQILLLSPDGGALLYQCRRITEEEDPPEEGDQEPTAEEAAELRMEGLLAALGEMGDAGAALDSGAAPSPFFGSGDLGGVLSACESGQMGTELMDAMLLYWENAERRTAAEANLARAQQLLEETEALGGSSDGLEEQAAALESAIERCTGEMGKAVLAAQAAGADPAQCDVTGAAVLFDPAQLDVEDLALTAAAFAQSKGETVDAAALALELKTALVDLAASYRGVLDAARQYEDAGAAARQAAGDYAMELGGKAEWFAALSAKEDARAALTSAIAGFSRQANALNGVSGGWIARSCDWYASEFTALFQMDAAPSTKEEETPPEDRLEEILQKTLEEQAAAEQAEEQTEEGM